MIFAWLAWNGIRKKLDRDGWTIVAVDEGASGPAFAYTVGLSAKFGSPELCVAGLPSRAAGELLRKLVEDVGAGRVQEQTLSGGPGDLGRLGGVPVAGLVRVPGKDVAIIDDGGPGIEKLFFLHLSGDQALGCCTNELQVDNCGRTQSLNRLQPALGWADDFRERTEF